MSTSTESRRTSFLLADAPTLVVRLVADAAIAEQLAEIELPLAELPVDLDFSQIDSVNSRDLSALIRFGVKVREMNRVLNLRHVGPVLQEIFSITRFGRWSIS